MNYVQSAYGQKDGGPSAYNRGGQQRQDQKTRAPRDDRPFPNFGVSNAWLFKKLMAEGVMGQVLGKTMTEPFPGWYRPELTSVYHLSTPGHSIETCVGFRRHVLGLIEKGIVKIDEGPPSTINNPLPAHGGGN